MFDETLRVAVYRTFAETGREPAAAADYFRAAGLEGLFWGLA